MFPQYRQGETVRLTDDPADLEPCDKQHAGRTGVIEHVVLDGSNRQWLYRVRVPGDLVLTTGDGLKARADDLSA